MHGLRHSGKRHTNVQSQSEGILESWAGKRALGDFTTTSRVIPISALAMVIGAVCAFVALALLRLIGLFTNLFYFGRWSTALVSPAGNHLGIFACWCPSPAR